MRGPVPVLIVARASKGTRAPVDDLTYNIESDAGSLWNPGATEAGAKTDCLFNRTLIFPTTDTSLHGFPGPIACPENVTRKSISLFYWTMDESAVKTAQNINFLPGKKETQMKALLRSFVPPILFKAKGKLNQALKKS